MAQTSFGTYANLPVTLTEDDYYYATDIDVLFRGDATNAPKAINGRGEEVDGWASIKDVQYQADSKLDRIEGFTGLERTVFRLPMDAGKFVESGARGLASFFDSATGSIRCAVGDETEIRVRFRIEKLSPKLNDITINTEVEGVPIELVPRIASANDVGVDVEYSTKFRVSTAGDDNRNIVFDILSSGLILVYDISYTIYYITP